MLSWNEYKPLITKELVYNFHAYLNQKKSLERKKLTDNKKRYVQQNQTNYNDNNEVYWIEKLLEIPIERPRRICVDLFFVPYFIIVKYLPFPK